MAACWFQLVRVLQLPSNLQVPLEDNQCKRPLLLLLRLVESNQGEGAHEERECQLVPSAVVNSPERTKRL